MTGFQIILSLCYHALHLFGILIKHHVTLKCLGHLQCDDIETTKIPRNVPPICYVATTFSVMTNFDLMRILHNSNVHI